MTPELSRHAPRTGAMRRLLGRFHYAGPFWYELHLWSVRHLPEWALRVAVPTFTVLMFSCAGGVRRALSANQTLVQGPAGWWTRTLRTYRTARNFSWSLTERYEQLVPDKRPRVELEDPEHWHELTRGDRGLIVVTSHIGNWEIGSAAPGVDGQPVPVHVVREPELDEGSQAFVQNVVGEIGGGNYVTHFATDDPSLGIELLDALRKGEVVALQADRPRARGQSERVSILGHDFELPIGPVALARIAEVPLLPSFTLRVARGRYRIVFRDPIRVPRTRDRDADHRAALEEIGKALEWALREAPEQWFCFADLSRLDEEAQGRAGE